MRDCAKQNFKKGEIERGNNISSKPKPGKVLSQDKNSSVEQVLHLQRTVGNRAVTRFIQSETIQCQSVSDVNGIFLRYWEATLRRQEPLTRGEENNEEQVRGGEEEEINNISSNSGRMTINSFERFPEINRGLRLFENPFGYGYPVFQLILTDSNADQTNFAERLPEELRRSIEEVVRNRISNQLWVETFNSLSTEGERNSWLIDEISSILRGINPALSEAFINVINSGPPNDWREEVSSLNINRPNERLQETEFWEDVVSITLKAVTLAINYGINKVRDSLSEEESEMQERMTREDNRE